ncbi:glycine betaine ABC transporter substrate-binding protein [Lysinibacter cavernae]|uniref:Glycine betaine/proline transport system substrate-binding protein n=1 Tax=Lysinibacter cavernae TaxID=1640652 RepID=A0A7X5TVG6_9MICO|nr:glycine betaine ABC transporter substrate-binding protein [Lysinibacter cavernae]NIH55162.1 glycine betaine/proline transport system substrate-binding protein [Lysinibacter cavernae]
MKNTRLTTTLATAAVAGLLLAGCSAGDEGDNSKSLKIAVFNGWDEGIAASELWAAILEEKGYDVSLEYADVAPVFSGLSSKDYDVTLDSWLPTIHSAYLEEYKDSIVDLGPWNTEATLTMAVNADSPITSLTELADHADEFGNRIVSIEPGASMIDTIQYDVIPGYGLDDMDFITSSTPAMLTELSTALKNNENIVVTLWQPHWAYAEFDIRNLDDPDGLLGETEAIHSVARVGLDTDKPEVYEWLSNFEMDAQLLHSLENAMFNSGEKIDDYRPIVEQWITENQDYVDGLTA